MHKGTTGKMPKALQQITYKEEGRLRLKKTKRHDFFCGVFLGGQLKCFIFVSDKSK